MIVNSLNIKRKFSSIRTILHIDEFCVFPFKVFNVGFSISYVVRLYKLNLKTIPMKQVT